LSSYSVILFSQRYKLNSTVFPDVVSDCSARFTRDFVIAFEEESTREITKIFLKSKFDDFIRTTVEHGRGRKLGCRAIVGAAANGKSYRER
jgi:hypothetical protein